MPTKYYHCDQCNSGHNLLRVIERFKHEKSSDDEYDQWNQETNVFETWIRNRKDLRHVIRIEGYVTTIIRDYSEKQFREHFRMNKKTFEKLERILTSNLIRTAETGKFTLDVRTQLLSVLWLLATSDSFRSVSDCFGISKSILHDSMRIVVTVLNNL